MGWLTRAIDAGKDHRNPLDGRRRGSLRRPRRPAGEALPVLDAARPLGDDRRRRRRRRRHAGRDRRHDRRPARHADLRRRAGDRHGFVQAPARRAGPARRRHRRQHRHRGRHRCAHRPGDAASTPTRRSSGARRPGCSTWSSRSRPASPARSPSPAATCRTSSPAWRSPSRWSPCWPSSASPWARVTSTSRGEPFCSSSPTSPRSWSRARSRSGRRVTHARRPNAIPGSRAERGSSSSSSSSPCSCPWVSPRCAPAATRATCARPPTPRRSGSTGPSWELDSVHVRRRRDRHHGARVGRAAAGRRAQDQRASRRARGPGRARRGERDDDGAAAAVGERAPGRGDGRRGAHERRLLSVAYDPVAALHRSTPRSLGDPVDGVVDVGGDVESRRARRRRSR